MATDLYSKQILFNDGEGLFHGDLNNVQHQINRQLFDNLLLSMVPDAYSVDPTIPGEAVDPELNYLSNLLFHVPTDQVLAPIPGAGFFYPGGSARTLVSFPGPLLFPLSDPSTPPTDLALVPFRFGSYTIGDVTLTTGVGDATNPRIDIVEVKVEFEDGEPTSVDFEDGTTHAITTTSFNKARRVKATFQIKAGTPAATPTYPTPTAGFRAMTAVWIPATHNAVHSATNIRDLRFPLGGVRVYDTYSPDWILSLGTNLWGTSNSVAAVAPASASPFYAPCPVQGKNARLIGVGVYGYSAGSPAVNLIKIVPNTGGGFTETNIAQLDAQLLAAAAHRQVSVLSLMDYIAAGTGVIKGNRAANSWVGTPIWCSGDTAGPAKNRNDFPTEEGGLALKINADVTSFVTKVRWIVAHGLS